MSPDEFFLQSGEYEAAAPALAEERIIELPFGRGVIAAKLWHADAPGTPILAVHGWLDNAATFDRLAPLMPGQPIWAVDLAGHGLSSHRPDGYRYHNLDYLDDLVLVLDILGLDSVVLLGHSLGAGLSLMLAALFPERVARLLLIEGFGPLSSAPSDWTPKTRRAIDQLRQYRPQRRFLTDEDTAIKARMNGMTGPLSRESAELLCVRGIEHTPKGLLWRTDKRLRLDSLMRFHEEQVLAAITAIRSPTLLIRAEHMAAFFNVETYQARLAAHHWLQVVTLPGGHHLHLEESPEAVAAALIAFSGETGQAI